MERVLLMYVLLLFAFAEVDSQKIIKDTSSVDVLYGDVIAEEEDTVIYDTHNSILPEVIVYGINKVQRPNPKISNIDMQLIGIQPDDMNFKPLRLLSKILHLFFRKKHKESKRERMIRLLNEYDMVLPLQEKQKETEYKPDKD